MATPLSDAFGRYRLEWMADTDGEHPRKRQGNQRGLDKKKKKNKKRKKMRKKKRKKKNNKESIASKTMLLQNTSTCTADSQQ